MSKFVSEVHSVNGNLKFLKEFKDPVWDPNKNHPKVPNVPNVAPVKVPAEKAGRSAFGATDYFKPDQPPNRIR